MTVNKKQVDYKVIQLEGDTALVTEDGVYIPAYSIDGDTVVTMILDGTACIHAFDGSYYFNLFDMSVDVLSELEIDMPLLDNLRLTTRQLFPKDN